MGPNVRIVPSRLSFSLPDSVPIEDTLDDVLSAPNSLSPMEIPTSCWERPSVDDKPDISYIVEWDRLFIIIIIIIRIVIIMILFPTIYYGDTRP